MTKETLEFPVRTPSGVVRTPLSRQEVFDRAWTHFVVERHPASMDESGRSCLYRSPSGDACAVGILIPDDFYSQRVEKTSASDAIEDLNLAGLFQETRDLLGYDTGAFLDELQRCHDDSVLHPEENYGSRMFHSQVEGRLRFFAKRFFLNVPEKHNP